MADTYEQGVVIRVSTEGTLEITKLTQEIDKLHDSAEKANGVAADIGAKLQEMASGALAAVAAYVTLDAAIDTFVEGMHKMAEIQDVTRAITLFTGSLQTAK